MKSTPTFASLDPVTRAKALLDVIYPAMVVNGLPDDWALAAAAKIRGTVRRIYGEDES